MSWLTLGYPRPRKYNCTYYVRTASVPIYLRTWLGFPHASKLLNYEGQYKTHTSIDTWHTDKTYHWDTIGICLCIRTGTISLKEVFSFTTMHANAYYVRVCQCAKSHKVHAAQSSNHYLGHKWFISQKKSKNNLFFKLHQALRSLFSTVCSGRFWKKSIH